MEFMKTIFIQDNELEYLPESICTLKLLESLSLINNNLKSLPENIGNLKSLINLALIGNPFLKSLPLSITQLDNLSNLALDDRTLSNFPKDFEILRKIGFLNTKI